MKRVTVDFYMSLVKYRISKHINSRDVISDDLFYNLKKSLTNVKNI